MFRFTVRVGFGGNLYDWTGMAWQYPFLTVLSNSYVFGLWVIMDTNSMYHVSCTYYVILQLIV